MDKEARKDAYVILQATAVGAPDALPSLLRKAREIDREFLARLERVPLVKLRIRYEEIDPIRAQRIQQLLAVSRALLAPPWSGLRRAARASYPKEEFQALLGEHLRLYAREVHALSRALRLVALTMEAQVDSLARDVTGLVYDW